MNTSQPVSTQRAAYQRVAVIGAGACGLATAKCLLDEALEPTVFERSVEIGGVWNFHEELPDGGSLSYRSLRANTSSRMMAFSDFPFPEQAPDFPRRADVLQYLNDYADHHKLRDHIRLNTAVESAIPTETGQWVLTMRSGEEVVEQVFDALVVCSGLYQLPIVPSIPGADTFRGTQMHSRSYKGPEDFEGRTVLVIGAGSSGADIAVELSRMAQLVLISMRNGAWTIPHYIDQRPYDYQFTRLSALIPYRLRLPVLRQRLVRAYRLMGIEDRVWRPKAPPFDIWRSRLTVNSELLSRVAAGAIGIRPGIARLDANHVIFDDGTQERISAIIYCTGYSPAFPFLDESVVKPAGDMMALYKNTFHADLPNLAFISLCTVAGPLFPVAEMQARWAARVFSGAVGLPSPAQRGQDVQRQAALARRRGAHPLRVQLLDYMDEIAAIIGVRPNVLRHPGLAIPLLAGPVVAAQYRLDGPGRWAQAESYIRTLGAPMAASLQSSPR